MSRAHRFEWAIIRCIQPLRHEPFHQSLTAAHAHPMGYLAMWTILRQEKPKACLTPEQATPYMPPVRPDHIGGWRRGSSAG